jgi:hypothetical protein
MGQKEGGEGRHNPKKSAYKTSTIFALKVNLSHVASTNMTSRIPPLLEPYLALPPEASLILLTSVLGASSNWLVLRYVHNALISQDAGYGMSPQEEIKVLVVSFMRDYAFWKENGKRLVG